MMSCIRGRFPALALLLVVAAVLAVPSIAAADTVTATKLTLEAPSRADLGKPVRLVATLRDGSGKPLPKASVAIYTTATFLSVASGPIEIGRATTNDSGVAVFDYVPTRNTPTEIRAEFEGADKYSASQAMATFQVEGTGQVIHTESGFDVPFLNKWLLGGLLIIIWSLYVFVVSRILNIAHSHAGAHQGSR